MQAFAMSIESRLASLAQKVDALQGENSWGRRRSREQDMKTEDLRRQKQRHESHQQQQRALEIGTASAGNAAGRSLSKSASTPAFNKRSTMLSPMIGGGVLPRNAANKPPDGVGVDLEELAKAVWSAHNKSLQGDTVDLNELAKSVWWSNIDQSLTQAMTLPNVDTSEGRSAAEGAAQQRLHTTVTQRQLQDWADSSERQQQDWAGYSQRQQQVSSRTWQALAYPVGSFVEYHSMTHNCWIPATVLAFHLDKRAYDLSCKQLAMPERIRWPAAPAHEPDDADVKEGASAAKFPVGLSVEYESVTAEGCWIPAQVVAYHPETGLYDLDCKQQVLQKKIRAPDLFPVGAVVEYRSTSAGQGLGWIPTQVLAFHDTSGLYDLSCKANAPRRQIRWPQCTQQEPMPQGASAA
mmetsp:Transcript_140544/g.269554  ORF Transcript_140544/g.269554 Transcript_140544/m.269554 type:complete len:408 (-) Transcript_140544:93-1316(-)